MKDYGQKIGIEQEFMKYKAFMCIKCEFYKDGICLKKRLANECAKKNLRGKD